LSVSLHIIQGAEGHYPAADINIVIDVIRAFTVSHLAFARGAREIFLVNTVEEAFALKAENPALLLAGEVGGLPIDGFDLDNSPHTFSLASFENKSLVQKTTNGVKATLFALNATATFVTGLSNAKKTALHARHLASRHAQFKVNVIASHPSHDDDLACAQYIKDQLLDLNRVSLSETQYRIKTSTPAQKFYDPAQTAFNEKDLFHCLQEVPSDFVMQVDKSQLLPRIVRVLAD
jgi:2-phosphosulfolactate phosphatase